MKKQAHEELVRVYDEHAEWFDRVRRDGSFPEKRYLDLLLGTIGRKGAVLDLGCGSGAPIARYLLQTGMQVTGIDASREMIALASRSLPSAEWLVGDMRSLSLGRRFEAIVAWDSFFHLTRDEQRAMFPIFSTYLVDDGVLLFTAGPRDGEVYGEINGSPVYHSSMATAEYEALLADSGFGVLRHVVEDPDCGDHTVWLVQKRV